MENPLAKWATEHGFRFVEDETWESPEIYERIAWLLFASLTQAENELSDDDIMCGFYAIKKMLQMRVGNRKDHAQAFRDAIQEKNWKQ